MFDGRVKDMLTRVKGMLTRVNEKSQTMYNKKLSEFKASNTNAVIHFLLRISSPYYRGLLKDFSGLKSKIFFSYNNRMSVLSKPIPVAVRSKV